MVPTSWDGSSLEIQLLRPREWLVAAGAFSGSTIHLDLEEMGAHGPALVQNITSAPEIASGDGEVVTGTFRHSSGNVIQLYVAGLVEPIGTTSNHPFWSHDRQQFVPAGELIVGENLRTEDGRTIAVTASVVQDEELSVFNLEINTEHVYYVTQDAVLVHNSYAPKEAVETIFKAPRPGKGRSLLNDGFDPKHFADGDQAAYFAKQRELAEQYAKHYGEGVLEVDIPKSIYDSRIKPHEVPYLSDPSLIEIPVPHSAFDVLNDATRRLGGG